MKKNRAALSAFFLMCSLAALCQAQKEKAAAGQQLYRTYCQSCHGEAAKGNGPVAQYLVLPPADLTKIASRRNGFFPEKEIYRIIDGRKTVRVHGTSDMPVWGYTFRNLESPEGIKENIAELAAYLKSIQETD